MGKREMEMIETIIKRNFPEEFHSTYDAKGVHNIQKNYFKETADGNYALDVTEYELTEDEESAITNSVTFPAPEAP